ncbi:hypothetical protein OSB04_un000900 [Centaurea solstitialis]|uniref:Uncharacterized protein n=1 Tax=Centaurea solstitialis TaxID=347529 RepID=A0AA38SMQ6_9ASTR|nr:hypothetical protein OSB04_un000900 [Centaurea solstitialis]
MSGVWVFKNGVVRLQDNPSFQGSSRRKVLVHVATNQVVTSYEVLERMLLPLGWERYYNDPDLFQFHRSSSVHLISLPKDFNKLKSMHLYDIVVKARPNLTGKRICNSPWGSSFLIGDEVGDVIIFQAGMETRRGQRLEIEDETYHPNPHALRIFLL